MSKYRPDKIQLRTPVSVADRFHDVLKNQLHNRAKLQREDDDNEAVFSFWPTRSEYLTVAIIIGALSDQIAEENKNNTKQ